MQNNDDFYDFKKISLRQKKKKKNRFYGFSLFCIATKTIYEKSDVKSLRVFTKPEKRSPHEAE